MPSLLLQCRSCRAVRRSVIPCFSAHHCLLCARIVSVDAHGSIWRLVRACRFSVGVALLMRSTAAAAPASGVECSRMAERGCGAWAGTSGSERLPIWPRSSTPVVWLFVCMYSQRSFIPLRSACHSSKSFSPCVPQRTVSLFPLPSAFFCRCLLRP
jgi:hypothetical protein